MSSSTSGTIFHLSDSQCSQEKCPIQQPTLTLQDSAVTFDPRNELSTGDWVLVNYFGDFYPGQIHLTDTTNKMCCISCLLKYGSFFRYPENKSSDDIHDYPIHDIIALIDEPELKNSRGDYTYSIRKQF